MTRQAEVGASLSTVERMRVRVALAGPGDRFVVTAAEMRAWLEAANRTEALALRVHEASVELMAHVREVQRARQVARRLLLAALVLSLAQLGVAIWLI